MADIILNGLKKAALFSGGVVFLFCLGIAVTCFCTAVFICLKRKNFSLKKRLPFIYAFVSVCALSLAIFVLDGIKSELLFFCIAVCLCFCAVISAIPVRGENTTDEERELIRFIDKSIENSPLPHFENNPDKETSESINKSSAQTLKANQPLQPASTRQNGLDLDFSHVRNVIARLNYFGLTPADKRQLHDLEVFLLQAERGDYSNDVKRKINEGLSALLKIMSKYGA